MNAYKVLGSIVYFEKQRACGLKEFNYLVRKDLVYALCDLHNRNLTQFGSSKKITRKAKRKKGKMEERKSKKRLWNLERKQCSQVLWAPEMESQGWRRPDISFSSAS